MNEWIKIRWYINVSMTCIVLWARFEPRLTSLRAVWCFKSSWTASNWALPSQAASLNVCNASLMSYWHAKGPGDKISTHASNISNNRSNLIFGCIINEWIPQTINGSTLDSRGSTNKMHTATLRTSCDSLSRHNPLARFLRAAMRKGKSTKRSGPSRASCSTVSLEAADTACLGNPPASWGHDSLLYCPYSAQQISHTLLL